MGGLAGGMLGLMNFIGGVILYLLIGSKAWKDSDGVVWARILFGGAFAGIILWATLLLFFFLLEDDRAVYFHFDIFVIYPLIGSVLAGLLGLLERSLE